MQTKEPYLCPRCFSNIIEGEQAGFLICMKCDKYFKKSTDKATLDIYKSEKLSPLSAKQEEDVMYVIQEWYVKWKDKLVNHTTKTNKFVYAKEDLKDLLIKRNKTAMEVREMRA